MPHEITYAGEAIERLKLNSREKPKYQVDAFRVMGGASSKTGIEETFYGSLGNSQILSTSHRVFYQKKTLHIEFNSTYGA